MKVIHKLVKQELMADDNKQQQSRPVTAVCVQLSASHVFGPSPKPLPGDVNVCMWRDYARFMNHRINSRLKSFNVLHSYVRS